MPTPDEIREKLAELLGRIASVPADSVRDTAVLKDLGIDSVATVELAEGVGTAFKLQLTDESVNEWRTVGDVVRTVQRGGYLATLPPPILDDPEKVGAFKQLAIVFALVGAGVGVFIGVAAAALLASGLDGGSLPPISAPIAAPTAVASESTSPPPAELAPASRPTLTANPGIVKTGDHFQLTGRLPRARPGETLHLEWREAGGTWAPFPVTVTARDDGTFESQVYISSPGEREFRVRSDGAGGSTPPTLVRIS
ncbi:MAG: acyl carrier protein [Aeromicrobium sp.]